MMKKILYFLLLIPCLAMGQVDHIGGIDISTVDYIGGIATADIDYFAGLELSGGETPVFFTDFETGNDPTYDSPTGTDDCADTNDAGDYCDDTTGTVVSGTEALLMYGSSSEVILPIAISDPGNEWYCSYWWRCGDVTTVAGFKIDNTTNTWVVARQSQDSDGSLKFLCADDAYSIDSNTVLSVDTYYKIGVYYKEGSGDGIIRVWISTDDTFTAGEMDIEQTNLNTGSSYNPDHLIPRGAISGQPTYMDDIYIYSGTPQWPTS